MTVCAKEKESSQSPSSYHYVVKAILKGYSRATDILKEKDRQENSKQYRQYTFLGSEFWWSSTAPSQCPPDCTHSTWCWK